MEKNRPQMRGGAGADAHYLTTGIWKKDKDKSIKERDRSYDVRLKGGERVALLTDKRWYGDIIPAGSTGTVKWGDSNAGFRGIEASVQFDDGPLVHSISTGKLEVL